MRTPTPRERAWIDNPRIRSGTTDTGADMAINPSPATKDKNELRELQLGQQQGMAKGGKVKATGPVKVHKGEQVIKRSSADKYGSRKMAAVNRGTAKVTTPKRK